MLQAKVESTPVLNGTYVLIEPGEAVLSRTVMAPKREALNTVSSVEVRSAVMNIYSLMN